MSNLHIVSKTNFQKEATLTVLNKPEFILITLNSPLTSETVLSFFNQLPKVINKSVIVDFKSVKAIDGTGLLALSTFFRHVRELGYNLTVVELSGQPLELFQELDIFKTFCQQRRKSDVHHFKYIDLTKRVMDIVISLLVLSIVLVPSLFLCLLIRLETPGLPIYSQVRSKRHKRETYLDISIPDKKDTFKIYKFRTMFKDAEKDGAVNADENDQRVTKIGKFLRKTRLDELPNFINVLIGDMSVVGPRADRPEIYKQVIKDFPIIFERSRFVKPGITGNAQLELMSNGDLPSDAHKLIGIIPEQDLHKKVLSFRYKLYYDTCYMIKHYKFFEWLKTDLKILLKTPIVMFFKKNVI